MIRLFLKLRISVQVSSSTVLLDAACSLGTMQQWPSTRPPLCGAFTSAPQCQNNWIFLFPGTTPATGTALQEAARLVVNREAWAPAISSP